MVKKINQKVILVNNPSEKILVEDYLLQKLQQKGWIYKKPEELKRELEEPLLIENLKEAIKRINKYKELTSFDISRVINELQSKIVGPETAKKILSYLKEGVPLKLEKTNQLKYIRLIDYENVENNEFIVSNQVKFLGKREIRADIVLFVNGIPLVIIECKDPTNPSETWEDAYRQIKNYEGDVPELFKYVQIGIAAEENVRYFPIVPWSKDVETHVWREENLDELNSIVEMLERRKLLDIIRSFIFIRSKKSIVTKVLPRYMQYRAANKIYERAIKYVKGEDSKNKGLIWHWQGSGKTFTMIFAAYKLYKDPVMENPTIFFVVDREELQEQLFNEIAALDLGIKPEKIESKSHLINVLMHDEGRGKRGFFVVLIHKFDRKELKEVEEYLEKELKGKESIMTRKNVICFVDEAQRTQYGVLAAEMKNILRSASFFAFSGTPIAKKGKDTFVQFSYPPDEKYLDKYFLDESQKDGFTVEIKYQPAIDKLLLEKKLLNEFLKQEKFEDIPENVKSKIVENLRKKFKPILESENRIREIAVYIDKHFKENFDGKFKAMVVAFSRKACLIYKRELDELMPGYSEVVMTMDERKDYPEITDYARKLRERFKGKEIDEILKEIVDKFNNEEYPKILIVTDMLLTGFDSPILQVMYLDKPMKGHKLLQAIARTNRPLPSKDKKCGIIIDFVGVTKELDKALKFYAELDKEIVMKNVLPLSDYENKANELIIKLKDLLKNPEIKYEREYLNKIVTNIVLEEKEKEFVEKYKELRSILELIGPSKIKLENQDFIKFLTVIYILYKKHLGEAEEIEKMKKYYRKLMDAISKSIRLEEIIEFPPIEINENFLDNLKKYWKDEYVGTYASMSLIRLVLREKPRKPIYISLEEVLDNLMKKWRERKVKVEEVYNEIRKIAGELKQIEDMKKEGIDEDLYQIIKVLRGIWSNKKDVIEKSKELYELLNRLTFPGWKSKKEVLSKIKREVKLFLIKNDGLTPEKREEVANEILKILLS